MKRIKRICGIVQAALLLMMSMSTVTAQSASEPLPIILYHNITYNYAKESHLLHIDPERFEEQLIAIQNAGYHTIFLEEYADYLAGKTTLPDNPLVITFDDGYTSNYEIAFPLLQKYGMKATIFVITSRMGTQETQYPHFSWAQAKEMEESGVIRIESHTDTHPDMSSLSPREQEEEIRRSKYLVDTKLHKTTKVLSFPYGLYTEGALEAAKQAGYEAAVLVGDRGSNKAENGTYHLKRYTVSGLQSGQELLSQIAHIKANPDE